MGGRGSSPAGHCRGSTCDPPSGNRGRRRKCSQPHTQHRPNPRWTGASTEETGHISEETQGNTVLDHSVQLPWASEAEPWASLSSCLRCSHSSVAPNGVSSEASPRLCSFPHNQVNRCPEWLQIWGPVSTPCACCLAKPLHSFSGLVLLTCDRSHGQLRGAGVGDPQPPHSCRPLHRSAELRGAQGSGENLCRGAEAPPAGRGNGPPDNLPSR